jgi:hypothetical protein
MSLFGCDDGAMGEGDGVYYSGSAYSGSDSAAPAADRRSVARRAKKAAVALVGLSAVGAGAYFGTMLLTGNTPGYSGGPAALAPAGPVFSSAPASAPISAAAPDGPSTGPLLGIRSGVRQAIRPSPTPSDLALTDGEVTAAQVSRLLQAAPQPAASGMSIASGPVTVSDEVGTDGSAIRVVAARYDLTGRWSPADRGHAAGDARCTQNLLVGLDPAPQLYPSMLMCWRTGPGRSVVTIASSTQGAPLDAASLDVLDQQWSSLG